MGSSFIQRALGAALALCLLCGGAAAETANVNDWLDTLNRFVTEAGSRAIYTEGEERAQAWLISEFESIGFSPEAGTLTRQTFPASDYDCREIAAGRELCNLIALQQAESPEPAVIIVSAHYDARPGTPGAKDNGSGVAALLTLARRLQAQRYDHTELRFIAFDGEEYGEYGSYAYVKALTESPEEKARVLAVFNIDLITLDADAEAMALSCNCLGGRTEEGYEEGAPDMAVPNKATLAFREALLEVDCFDPEDENLTFCAPRHWGDGDHIPFHEAEIDAATVCFQGNVLMSGAWPADMHTPEDDLKPFDLTLTGQALEILYRAIDGLARDHAYGSGRIDD